MILLPKLISAVKKTGAILLQNFGQPGMGEIIAQGMGGDLTMLADKVAEGALIYELKDLSPEIESEERGVFVLEKPEFRLIIDPLDGSNNFSRGIYPWSISVYAETMEEEPLAGVVYDPVAKFLFYAENGGGAYLNDEPVSTIKRSLKDSAVSVFMHSRENFSFVSQGMQLLRPHVRKFVRFSCSSLELCWVASGKLDALVHLTPDARKYDYLASLLILKEAGGVYSDLEGETPKRSNSTLVAGGSDEVHKRILEILKPLNSL